MGCGHPSSPVPAGDTETGAGQEHLGWKEASGPSRAGPTFPHEPLILRGSTHHFIPSQSKPAPEFSLTSPGFLSSLSPGQVSLSSFTAHHGPFQTQPSRLPALPGCASYFLPPRHLCTHDALTIKSSMLICWQTPSQPSKPIP